MKLVKNNINSTRKKYTYYGKNSLTVSNTVIEAEGNADFKSAREVRLLPGFHAKAGSNTHIFISNDQPDCNEYDFNNSKK